MAASVIFTIAHFSGLFLKVVLYWELSWIYSILIFLQSLAAFGVLFPLCDSGQGVPRRVLAFFALLAFWASVSGMIAGINGFRAFALRDSSNVKGRIQEILPVEVSSNKRTYIHWRIEYCFKIESTDICAFDQMKPAPEIRVGDVREIRVSRLWHRIIMGVTPRKNTRTKGGG